MSDKADGVRGYKQISLKKFSKTISHNLRLLALSRGLNLYELHDQIVDDYTKQTPSELVKPEQTDKCHYNVFLGQAVQEQVSALADILKVPESEIIYSALITYADKLELNVPLVSAHAD